MAGMYCKYCDHRCFVHREVIVGGQVVWEGHMATCPAGAAHDRSVLGVDFTQAHNPRVCGHIVDSDTATICGEFAAHGDGVCLTHARQLAALEAAQRR